MVTSKINNSTLKITYLDLDWLVGFMVFNATFNNISAILRRHRFRNGGKKIK